MIQGHIFVTLHAKYWFSRSSLSFIKKRSAPSVKLTFRAPYETQMKKVLNFRNLFCIVPIILRMLITFEWKLRIFIGLHKTLENDLDNWGHSPFASKYGVVRITFSSTKVSTGSVQSKFGLLFLCFKDLCSSPKPRNWGLTFWEFST